MVLADLRTMEIMSTKGYVLILNFKEFENPLDNRVKGSEKRCFGIVKDLQTVGSRGSDITDILTSNNGVHVFLPMLNLYTEILKYIFNPSLLNRLIGKSMPHCCGHNVPWSKRHVPNIKRVALWRQTWTSKFNRSFFISINLIAFKKHHNLNVVWLRDSELTGSSDVGFLGLYRLTTDGSSDYQATSPAPQI